jgi:undecaprenyl-diphosphatase
MHPWLNAALLGLVEGLTEFIPVSSTGHLLIVERWLGHRPDWFNVFIQVGAALALLPLFWGKLFGYVTTLSQPTSRDYLLKLMVAFGITGAGGLVLDKLNYELPETLGPVAWATLIGAVVIWGVEQWRSGKIGSSQITWAVAIACGAAQLVAAVFPGTSRSGITIVIALMLGLSRSAAAEFSFVLGMITLTAAGGYKFLDAWKDGEIVGASSIELAIGFTTAAISAFLVVKWLLRFVQQHSFKGFAIYRLVLGALLLLLAR